MSGFFYNLGRQLGRKTVPAIRKSKLIWDGLAGTEAEALRAEAELGRGLAAELLAVSPRANDAAAAALVGDVCGRLSAGMPDPKRAFQCEVLLDDAPNAIALPGGFLFLSLSLADLCERRPAELAFVIGHEMAHVILRHAWNRVLNDGAMRVASAVTTHVSPWSGWMRQHGLRLLRGAFSRANELEADQLGARLALNAGFDPAGARAWLERLQPLERQPTKAGPYITSHPPAAERIARLETPPRR